MRRDVTMGRGLRWGLGAVCALLGACSDDVPVVATDTGSTDVAVDAADVTVADVPGEDVPAADVDVDAGDAGGQDAGADAADVTVVTDGGGDGGADGGADGGLTGLRAHRGAALVGAGGVMTSTGYRMISTLGQSSIHQGTLSSTGFRLRGGLVGATGGR